MNTGKRLIGTIIMLFALSGCGDDGTGPSGSDGAICGLSTTTLGFGTVLIGEESSLPFIIENTGDGTLSGTVSETSDEFTIVGEPSYSLDAGMSDTFTVQFTPAALGSRTCSVATGSTLCDAVQCAGIGGAHYYVDAASGLDANPGTSENPFKTITRAVQVAETNKIIGVLPGTYDTDLGETFPIRLKQGQMLIGNIPDKGLGTTATTIYGSGDASPGDSDLAAIVGADLSTVAGFNIGAPYYIVTFGIYFSNAAVTITDNSFTSATTNLYGGIRARGTGAAVIMRNDFLTSSYGVYGAYCSGAMVVESNNFQTMAIPVDLTGNTNNTIVRGNTFVGNGQIGIQVQDGHPLIENNVFNNPGGYATYGAIRCQNETANPTIRGNTFTCARGITTYNSLAVDIGTSGDPGGNNFSGVTGEAIYHNGTAALNAIGNIWRNTPPVCGTDIVIEATGTITWGTDPGEDCP
jgi:parallel beta-helix repeat protein